MQTENETDTCMSKIKALNMTNISMKQVLQSLFSMDKRRSLSGNTHVQNNLGSSKNYKINYFLFFFIFIINITKSHSHHHMQMESSSAPKFRFRDHSLPGSRNSIHSSEPSSDDVVSVLSLSNSNISSDQPDVNAKLDIESITGRVRTSILHI
jgi:hypothetical protein